MFENVFLFQDFWVDSLVSQALGSHFKMLITQTKSKQIKMAQEDLFGGKNRIKIIS